MFFGMILNAVVLGVIVLLVTKGQNKPDISILLGLPLGLGLLSSVLFLYLGWIAIILSLGIAIFTLRWAFDLSAKQSIMTTSIWGVWQVVYSLL